MKFYFSSSSGVSVYQGGTVTTAILDDHGLKRVDTNSTFNKVIFWNFFFLRGLQYFIFGLFAQLQAFFLADELQEFVGREKTKLDKMAERLNIATRYVQLLTGIIVGLILGYLLFALLPFHLTLTILPAASRYGQGAFIGLIRMATIFLLFLLLRFLPIMQGLYRFNGATNQVVNSKENAAKISKESHHFALNYLNYLVFALMLGSFVVSLVAISGKFYFIYNMLILLGVAGISYEILWLISRAPQRWIRDFVILTSFLISMKPGTTQDETIRVLLIEDSYEKDFTRLQEDRVPMSAIVGEMQTKLMQADRYAQSDVDWIIATVLGKNRAEIKLVRSVSKKEARDILRAGARRAKGEPLSSIFGFVEFYGLRFDVNKKVLSPRMETEILVEETLKLAKNFENPHICDLCTGSGAIAISIVKNLEKCKVCGIDISKPALQVAESNAKKLEAKVDFHEGDLLKGLKKGKKFDIIVSNPPYIKRKTIEQLSVEVKKYDPLIALDGGEDGLDFYREIVTDAPLHLNKGGYLAFELGKGQAAAVKTMMKEKGFIDIKVIKDYNTIERVIYGRIS